MGVEEEAETDKATRDMYKGNKKPAGASIKLIILYLSYYHKVCILYVCNQMPNIFYLSLFIET